MRIAHVDVAPHQQRQEGHAEDRLGQSKSGDYLLGTGHQQLAADDDRDERADKQSRRSSAPEPFRFFEHLRNFLPKWPVTS